MQRRQIRLDNPPASFTKALRADSARSGRSVNDIACGILAAHYGHAYSETGRRSRNGAGGLVLKIPEPIWFSVRLDAASKARTSIKDRVIDIVHAHYKKGTP